MATIIPFKPSKGRYRFVTVIDGAQYIFKVRWNSREQAWYFDVLEHDETPIVQGVKIVLGTNFAKTSNHPLFLNGNMFARCFSKPHADPTFDTLGVSVQVFYFNRGDIVDNILSAISPAD